MINAEDELRKLLDQQLILSIAFEIKVRLLRYEGELIADDDDPYRFPLLIPQYKNKNKESWRSPV